MNSSEYIAPFNIEKGGLVSEFQTIRIGTRQCPPCYTYGPTLRPVHLLVFINSGKGLSVINNNRYELSAGDTILVPSESVAFLKADSDDPWEYYWIAFSGTRTDMVVAQLRAFSQDGYILHGLTISNYTRAINRGAALDSLGNANSNFFFSNSVLLEIFGLLALEVNINSKRNRNGLAYEIRQYIDLKYPTKLRLTDVAARFNIHPGYMTRLFREEFGITPKKYLQTLKLTKACQLLRETDHSILVISMSLGYDDQLAFSKAFHKVYGRSPSAYRSDAHPHG